MKENFAYLKDVLGVQYFNLNTKFAKVLFVGKGLGDSKIAQDLIGLGPYGILLKNMISAMGLQESEVFWTQDESRFLEIKAQVTVFFGDDLAQTLFRSELSQSPKRGEFFEVDGRKILITHDLALLLKNPGEKKTTWSDLKLVIKELG